MANTRAIPDLQQLPGIAGKFVFDTWRGKVRVRKWPRKRGPGGTAQQLAWRKKFSQALALCKFADPVQVQLAMVATKGTGLYPRDLLTSRMLGGGYDIVTTDGLIVTKAEFFVEEVMFQGARIERTASFTTAAGVRAAIIWQDPIIDTAAIWSASQPTRLTVPTGTQIVRLTGGYQTGTAVDGFSELLVRKNGSEFIARINFETSTNACATLDTGPVNVVPGDYFELTIDTQNARTLLAGSPTFFGMELLQVSLS